jgi:hypothetical protein
MTEASAAKMDIDNNDDKPTIKVNKRQASVPEESIQMPWVEKYRPAKLEDLVAHEDIVSILTRLIDNDNLPHLLLYGPPGTGKVRTKNILPFMKLGYIYGNRYTCKCNVVFNYF